MRMHAHHYHNFHGLLKRLTQTSCPFGWGMGIFLGVCRDKSYVNVMTWHGHLCENGWTSTMCTVVSLKRPNTTIYARGLSSVLISVGKYVCRCVAQGCLVGPSCRLFWDPLEASLLGNFIAQKIGLSQIFERNVSHTMIAWLTHTSSRFHFSASFSSMPKIFNYDFLHSLLL